MFRFGTQFSGKFLLLSIVVMLAGACSNDKRVATSTAKSFLQAYYVDLDFDRALQLSNDASHSAIIEQAEIVALNPYAKEETPIISFLSLSLNKDNPHNATYTYTCNRTERTLPLQKTNGKWFVDLQGGLVETCGNNEFSTLSTNEGGFASAASGEIKYRKRRQAKKP